MKKTKVSLDEVYDLIEKHSISRRLIKNIFIAIFISLLIMFPKIYLSIRVYEISIKFNYLLDKYYALKDENSILKSKVERLKFKNRIEKLD